MGTHLSGWRGGISARFASTAMKKPPVSPWWGRMRMQRSKGICADALSANMLADKLLAFLTCTIRQSHICMHRVEVA